MSFPDSFSSFSYFDISSAFDLEAKLDQIIMGLDDNADDLSTLKSKSSDIQACVTKLCTDDVLEAVNDLGWRLMI